MGVVHLRITPFVGNYHPVRPNSISYSTIYTIHIFRYICGTNIGRDGSDGKHIKHISLKASAFNSSKTTFIDGHFCFNFALIAVCLAKKFNQTLVYIRFILLYYATLNCYVFL